MLGFHITITMTFGIRITNIKLEVVLKVNVKLLKVKLGFAG